MLHSHYRPCHTLRWNGSFSGDFELLGASQTIANHRWSSQVSPKRSQQSGQPATHDSLLLYSPAIVIAAMAIRNIKLSISTPISHERALMPLRCSKIACDALRCIFQHVGNFAPDSGISQLCIILFSNGFYHNDGNLIVFFLTFVSKVCGIYFFMPSRRWKSQEIMETFHHE